MRLLQPFLRLTLLSGLAQAIVLPQQHEERSSIRDLDTQVKVFLSSRTNIEDLAKELMINTACLKAANPSLWSLNHGESCIVPQACCGTSCKGKFCSKRPQCHGQSSLTAAPVQTGSSTTCYSTVTTSVNSTMLTSSTSTLPGYGSSVGSSAISTATIDETMSSRTSQHSSDLSSTTQSTATPSVSASQNQSETTVSTTSSEDQTSMSTSGVETSVPSTSPTVSTSTTSSGKNTDVPPGETSPSVSSSTIASSNETESSSIFPTSTASMISVGSSSLSVSTSSGNASATTITSPGDSLSSTPSISTGAGISQTTNSDGSVVIVPSSLAVSPSSTISGGLVTTTDSSGSVFTSTIQPPSSVIITTDSAEETVTSTILPSSSTIVTTDAAGETITSIIQPSITQSLLSSTITTTNSAGETVTSIVEPSLTQSPASSIVTTTDAGGATFTSVTQPSLTRSLSSSTITTTNAGGETVTSIIQPSSPTSFTTTDSDGETVTSLTQSPSSSTITTIDAAGETVTSLTQTSSSSTITTTNSAGETTTLISSVSPPSSNVVTSTNSDGSEITITQSSVASSSSGLLSSSSIDSISSASSLTSTTTGAEGASTTLTPSDSSVTLSSSSSSTGAGSSATTNSDGSVDVSTSSSTNLPPSGSGTSVVITNPGDSATLTSPAVASPTSSTTTSTDIAGGVIFPVVTPVPEPKGTEEGSVIPCNIWFFNICIDWLDLSISGWLFNLPEGIRPPGPPPAITFPPSLSITVNTIGNLPDWPTITIGPDNVPTPEPEPENCETESAELCLTRTSFGVSSTVTTNTQVLSTCATVYGCKVSDSATTTSTTSSCSTCSTCYSWPYDEGLDIGEEDADAGDVAVPDARRMMPRTVPAMTTPPVTTTTPHNALHKRVQTENRVSTTFGTCTLVATITMENYPAVSELANYPAASAYFVISKRSIDAEGTCHAGRIYSTSDIAGVSAADGEPAYATKAPWPRPTPGVNMDHVYENSLLARFFEYALELPDAPSCEQFKSYFVETGRLQSLYQKLANINNPDFAAMDKYINTLKASFFKVAGGLPKIQPGKYTQALDQLQGFGMVASFLNMPEIVSLFRSTHQRIYQAFGEWDQDFGLCNQDGLSDTWAATYSGWMTSFLSSRADFMTDSAAAWYQTLADGGDAAPVYTQLQNTYPVASFTVPVDAMAAGLTPAATQGVVPRQAACTLSAPQTSDGPLASSVAPPTDLPTLTRTTAISTPSGSSCVSTTTFEQCNGSGDQAACVTASGCGSWEATDIPTTSEVPTTSDVPTTTSTTPTSTTYEAPLFTSDVVCNNEADYPGHADVSSNAQQNLAEDFCNEHNTYMYPGPPGPPLAATLQDGDDINYYYNISWNDPDCRPEGSDRQNTYNPQGSGGITCPILMTAAYEGCNNGGVGGYIDIGCLRYRFEGAI